MSEILKLIVFLNQMNNISNFLLYLYKIMKNGTSFKIFDILFCKGI